MENKEREEGNILEINGEIQKIVSGQGVIIAAVSNLLVAVNAVII